MLYQYIYQRWGGWIQMFPTALIFLFNIYSSTVSCNYPHLPICIEIFQSKYNYPSRCFSIQLNSLFTWISHLHKIMNIAWYRYIEVFSSSCICTYKHRKNYMKILLTTCKLMSGEISMDRKQYYIVLYQWRFISQRWRG